MEMSFSSAMNTLARFKRHQITKRHWTSTEAHPNSGRKKQQRGNTKLIFLSLSLSNFSLWLSVCLSLSDSLFFFLPLSYSLSLSALVSYRFGLLRPEVQYNLCEGTFASSALYRSMPVLGIGSIAKEIPDSKPANCRQFLGMHCKLCPLIAAFAGILLLVLVRPALCDGKGPPVFPVARNRFSGQS